MEQTSEPTEKPEQSRRAGRKGNLRIGDHWNAITIIALSQSNPLKAIAEFVENSIDAKSKNITITRGKEGGKHYLRIVDDGNGIPKNGEGTPDFKYVATHVCDSLKRRMKLHGEQGIQGEFGIGLLSFWTVGEELILRSSGLDGQVYQMRMRKGEPSYSITHRKSLVCHAGTELIIRPLLSGVRGLSGEKLQWYLASELRNRLLESGVTVRIIDRQRRNEFLVVPQKYSGRRLSELPISDLADRHIRLEIYLNEPEPSNRISVYRHGTRVFESITDLEEFSKAPWNTGYFQGYIDIPFLTLTPGTRLGVIRDDQFAKALVALESLEENLAAIVEQQKKAENEQANKVTLSSLHRAFREALLALPPEEYDWFDIHKRVMRGNQTALTGSTTEAGSISDEDGIATNYPDASEDPSPQRQFFEFPGPLYRVTIHPASSLVSVTGTKRFAAKASDRKRVRVDNRIEFRWRITEGKGQLSSETGEFVEFTASSEPGLVHLQVSATQNEITVSAKAIVTITDSLIPNTVKPKDKQDKGLPAYTLQNAPGERWRARFEAERNLVIVNSGHKDFLFASRTQSLKLRYLCRLYSKELVLRNFPGLTSDELLERLIEITLYAEESLR